MGPPRARTSSRRLSTLAKPAWESSEWFRSSAVADLANAGISLARRNYADAVLDASSAIPVAGQGTGVLSAGIKLERGASAIAAVLGVRRAAKSADGLVATNRQIGRK